MHTSSFEKILKSTASSWTVPGGWAGSQSPGNVFSSNYNGIGMYFLVKTSAGAVNPTFTGTNITDNVQTIAGFEAQ